MLSAIRTISDMSGCGDYVTVVDYWGYDNIPLVYNVRTHEFVIFDDIEPAENIAYILGDNAGVFRIRGENYFFQRK